MGALHADPREPPEYGIGTDASLRDFLKEWAAEGLGALLSVLGGVGRNAARFGLAIIFQ